MKKGLNENENNIRDFTKKNSSCPVRLHDAAGLDSPARALSRLIFLIVYHWQTKWTHVQLECVQPVFNNAPT
jgi:hypothetical protein